MIIERFYYIINLYTISGIIWNYNDFSIMYYLKYLRFINLIGWPQIETRKIIIESKLLIYWASFQIICRNVYLTPCSISNKDSLI